MVNRCAGGVRQVNQDAFVVQLFDQLLAEIGKSVVNRSFGLEIANRVLNIVHKLDMSQAQVVSRLKTVQAPLQEISALTGQDHIRF